MFAFLKWIKPSPWDIGSLIINFGPGVVAAVVTFWAGYVGELSLAYLIPATVVSFAACAVIVNSISEWRERNRVKGRLMFGDVKWFSDPFPIQTAVPVDALQLGILLVNNGQFPISFEVNQTHFDFSGRVSGPASGTKGVVMPARLSTVRAPRVTFNPQIVVAPGGREIGHLVFEISYGRTDKRLRHKIAHRIQVAVVGTFAGQVPELTWQYAENEKIIVPSD